MPRSYAETPSLACALVSDETLAGPAGAVAARIAQRWGMDVHVFLERRDISASVPQTRIPGVTYHFETLLGEARDYLPDDPRFTMATWGRLFVPRALSHYDRVLYCDIDILLGPKPDWLETLALSHGLGMVRDYYIGMHYSRMCPDELRQSRGVDPAAYFNSGILLIDTARWDLDGILLALRDYLARFRPRLLDQDFLNHHFAGRITELSPNLNFQQSLMGLGIDHAVTPAIRHYCHDVKPYHRLPRRGAALAVERAAVEFRAMLAEAGLPQQALEPHSTPRAVHRFRASLDRLFYALGVRGRRATRLEVQWRDRRREVLSILRRSVSEGRFADPNILDLDAPLPRLQFRGHEIVPVAMPERSRR
ncbi:glycosyltransferase [Halodurantibacterium flavum]|uniref:Glycosyltransferase n=1 Tax=Halodurantibacterium flavum TaxID=1382802 RepID=A0ABW4S7R0_9RHOB